MNHNVDPRDVFMRDVDPDIYRVTLPSPRPVFKTLATRRAQPQRATAEPVLPPGVPVPMYMADEQCRQCAGTGARRTRRGLNICLCVWRGVTRHVVGHLQYLRRQPAHGNYLVMMRRAGYCADVELLARRLFRDNPREWKIFRLFILERRGWREVARRVGLNRGNLFHGVYRVQAAFGYAAVSTPLFPMQKYFGGFRYEGTVDYQPQHRAARRPFLAWSELWLR